MAEDASPAATPRGTPRTPKYQVIRDRLMEQIRSGTLSPGCRLPTERELADRFGVTRMTVRQAITTLVQSGMVVNRRPLGNFVAESLCGVASRRVVNLVCVGSGSEDAGVFLEHGVAAARSRGIEARVLQAHAGVEHLAVATVRGPDPTVLIGGPGGAHRELHRAVHTAADRVVVVGVRMDHAGIASVVGDDALGIRLAVGHLHGKGHERIALVGSTPEDDHPTMELQVELWRQAMDELGLARGTPDRHVIRLEPVPAGGTAMASKLAVEAYHRRRRVRATAYIGLSAETGVGVLAALHGSGVRVPRDASVVGYATHLRASLCVPPLTGIDVDVGGHLAAALDRVERMLSAEEGAPVLPLLQVVPPFLIERGSVGPRR
ncbi:GntR family transcriptional regulator [Phycisphaera mikurensis]|uniref:Putative GntR family transcriptional regulator n=1 Tax=Phycisphaera mikurensis (strain NBRC 102666 / KCTC 22515 / FYK2301M01) TaxID=1142394 RepID=I0IH88_PHYMF|nr:substrate-binding domain-containing protein [Phycisphaera mikurensis]MBB6440875.1 DNA-binding LacI/PurR family transcriptional regulator [Phycisphaera mikurensis]BAM04626.1 putative GntR family transcriptional regulator [Phycisphaera mikurensis NBRC 102666]